jgi:hypothetical protein
MVRPSLPIPETIAAAQATAREWAIAFADDPGCVQRYGYRIPFEVARSIRAVPGVSERTKPTALLDGVLAAHKILAEHLVDHDHGDGANFMTAFGVAWGQVKYPRGQGPLEVAVTRATETPIAIQTLWPGKYRLFLSVTYYLQQHAGDAPFFLAADKLGKLLCVEGRTVRNWITLAIGNGHLRYEDVTYEIRKRARTLRFVSALDVQARS